jgi:O-antigen ligase
MVSIAPEFSRYAFDIISKLLLMYFLATAIVNDEKKIRIVMEVYMFSFILLAWWATGKYYFEGIMNIEDALAYSGSYSDRNFFAMLFVMSLPFCILYPFTIKKNITRYIVWFFAPIMMNVIYITASRGGFLGMVMSGLASGIKIKSKKIMLVALIIGIVLGIRLMGQRAGDRIKTIFVEEGERDAAATSRKDAWKRAINCSVENPLGIGPYCFQLYKSAGFGGAPAAHNFYLQVAAEQGIASALILVFLILLSFWDLGVIIRISKNDSRLINYYYYASMITASLCGFVLSSVFLSLSMFEPFYFLVAMTVILKNVLLKELSK